MSGCPVPDALFSVTKTVDVIYYHIKIERNIISKMSSKKKLGQRKEFKEYLSIADKRVLDIKKSGIELVSDDEIFVLAHDTNNYWISNQGDL